jgi:uncharacterized spore protein YtfJ
MSETEKSMTTGEHQQLDGWDTPGAVLGRVLAAAHPATVFGQPQTCGDRTIITVSEVRGGAGYGFGRHFGRGAAPAGGEQGEGSGGGGGAVGRAVAVVIVGPDGAEIKPIVDVTAFARTAIITLGIVAALVMRKRR